MSITYFKKIYRKLKMNSKKFGIIVADPPWSFNDKLKYPKDSVKRGADAIYPTLNMPAIKALPVNELVQENAILALWVPSAMLQFGMEVVESWGFTYKQLWVWGKTSKKDPTRLAFGMGRLARNCHEPCIVGVKGKYTKFLKNHSQRNLFMHPSLPHSQKPDDIQESLELMFPQWRKVELFARRDRPGWECIGNEAPKTAGQDIRTSLDDLIRSFGGAPQNQKAV